MGIALDGTGEFEIEKDVAWPNGGRSLYFRDPAGNCLELASPLVWGMAEGNIDSKNSMNQPDEFYIGWEAKAAPSIGKKVRKAVMALLLLALLAPLVFAVSQRMIGASVFEWGTHKSFLRHFAGAAVSAPARVATRQY